MRRTLCNAITVRWPFQSARICTAKCQSADFSTLLHSVEWNVSCNLLSPSHLPPKFLGALSGRAITLSPSQAIKLLSPLSSQVRFSKHSLKPPTEKIVHPYVAAPEHLPPAPCFRANLDPMQTFIPFGYHRQVKLEALRSGEYLGEDYPWNLLRKWKDWRRRKYNCSHQTVPWMISDVKGVHYNESLNCWSAQWHEDGVHRIRRFRAAFGLMKAKESAEDFRKVLEAAGRVDNCRTERQLRMRYLANKSERQLRKKRFTKVSSGKF